MKRRATGLTMQLISPKSSFPIQDGKHSRQIDQMSQNNRLAASTNKLSVSLLKRCGVDARSLVEIKRRHAQKRTSLSALKVLGAYRTDCAAYFQKVLDTPITGNTITRYSVLGTRYSVLDTRYSLTSFHNKQNSTFISSLIHENAQSGFFYPFARFFVYGHFVRTFRPLWLKRYFCKGAFL